jgi:aromatic ring-opening dioxygenase catalytic subunit (LigB family)
VPRVICDLEFDFPGAPDLAKLVHAAAKEHGILTTNVTTPHFPYHYPTINIVHWLHRGEQVLSTGICQTAEPDDFLAYGAVIGEAIARSDRRVALIGSGGMSHQFWPLRELADHMSYDPADVISDDARAVDLRIIDLWARGDHAEVIDLYPELRALSPEGRFGHYLIPVGALGGRECRAPGEQLSSYESSVGTGQVHVWFDLEKKVRS